MENPQVQAEPVIDFSQDPPDESAMLPERDAREAERDLVERLRLALLASDPSVAPELVRGDSADEVEASFAAAQGVVRAIREQLIREQAGAIPAGAPGRTVQGPRSAYDKIRAGLARP